MILFIFDCTGSLSLCLALLQRGLLLFAVRGLSLPWLLSCCTGCRHVGSVVVLCGLTCSTACGIFPDRESSPCPLHWRADFYPLDHQGSPKGNIAELCWASLEPKRRGLGCWSLQPFANSKRNTHLQVRAPSPSSTTAASFFCRSWCCHGGRKAQGRSQD